MIGITTQADQEQLFLEQQKEIDGTVAMLMDLALYSEGMVTYDQAKKLTPSELSTLQTRLERYYKEKAKAMGGTKDYL